MNQTEIQIQNQPLPRPDIDLKIKEAETCYSMGMIEEALQLYQHILDSDNNPTTPAQRVLTEKIERLKKEIQELQASEKKGLSVEEISIFKKTLSGQTDVPTLLDGAAALKELGLMEEAAAEYEKLLQLGPVVCEFSKSDCTPIKIICDYLACLLETRDASEVIQKAAQNTHRFNLINKDSARIHLWLGQQFEKRGLYDLAYDFFRKSLELDGSDAHVAECLNALKGKLSNSSRYDYLLRNKIVSTHQLQEALNIAKKINKSVEYILADRFKVDIQEVGKSLSMFYGCSFRTFDPETPIPFELINNLKKSFLLYYVWVPLRWDKTGIEILVDDPKDLRKTDHIRALIGNQKISISVAIKEDVEKYIQHFFDPRAEKMTDAGAEDLDQIIPDISFEEEDDIQDDRPALDESSSQVVKFVDQVLVTAFRNNASDIHIEPSVITRKTTIRFRTDGVCHEYIQIPNAMAPAIISRLKIMAELDIAEKRLPQDGKIKVRRKGIQEFELRLSTMPTAGKFEDAVLRILTRTNSLKIEEIGLNERNHSVLKKLIARPYGMILCVGPTGSGKTTTLHAILGDINLPGVKIWTAEDPVEITQRGLRQVQVRPKIGLDFARIMRGFLRLDPDIIMIGEMRDKETATIALQAALTGHLVLSTLHTNNAPETLTRLLDMGMNPLNISDAFLGVLGQRLVRRLCPNCSESYHPAAEEFEDLRADYGTERFDKSGYAYSPGFNLRRSPGCEKCNGSGFKGRIGIHELMEATTDIKMLIKKNATSFELGRQAVCDGMSTLKQDGIQKIINGITTIREVRRVCVD
jgi:type II secretory ATPase GspE/PulE/Tfp pilus assembly ATPase PilB-like protein/tetratricopeptide (TPR) repeat protein